MVGLSVVGTQTVSVFWFAAVVGVALAAALFSVAEVEPDDEADVDAEPLAEFEAPAVVFVVADPLVEALDDLLSAALGEPDAFSEALVVGLAVLVGRAEPVEPVEPPAEPDGEAEVLSEGVGDADVGKPRPEGCGPGVAPGAAC